MSGSATAQKQNGDGFVVKVRVSSVTAVVRISQHHCQQADQHWQMFLEQAFLLAGICYGRFSSFYLRQGCSFKVGNWRTVRSCTLSENDTGYLTTSTRQDRTERSDCPSWLRNSGNKRLCLFLSHVYLFSFTSPLLDLYLPKDIVIITVTKERIFKTKCQISVFSHFSA